MFSLLEIIGIAVGATGAGILAVFGFKVYQLKKKADRIEDMLSAPAHAEGEPQEGIADMINEVTQMTEEMGLDIEEVNNLEESQNLEDND